MSEYTCTTETSQLVPMFLVSHVAENPVINTGEIVSFWPETVGSLGVSRIRFFHPGETNTTWNYETEADRDAEWERLRKLLGGGV